VPKKVGVSLCRLTNAFTFRAFRKNHQKKQAYSKKGHI
jgi:hypothetical protein